MAIDVSTRETNGDIWVFDLVRGSSRRLTQDPVDTTRPAWSGDDSQLYFLRVPDLYRIDVAAAAEPQRIYETPNQKAVYDLAPDDRRLLFSERIEGQTDLLVLDLETGEASDWLRTEYSEDSARISPDGANWPVWRRDGKELFYVSATADLMAVPTEMQSAREPIGKPQKLFSTSLRENYFDVSVDGQHFLLVERIDPDVRSITLIQNWAATPSVLRHSGSTR